VAAALQRLGRPRARVQGVIICSVVPWSLQTVEQASKRILSAAPVVVGRDVIVPIKNNYRYPKQVGQDRLVGAFAAKTLYGHPAVIIDLGTAITFDVVSASGSYEGGLIVPGLRLSLEALFQKTALLPRVDKIQFPKQLIGKHTEESILSGIINGYGAMCRGLIETIKKELSTPGPHDSKTQKTKRVHVIMTGGHTRLMKRYLQDMNIHGDEGLVLRGLGLIADYVQ
jgi:type III pantothenate kinase